MSRRHATSIIPTAMVNTIAANAHRGRYCSGPVSTSSTNRAVAANASCAIWLRAPRRTAIAVCVGLPLTTNVPLIAAPIFAADNPRMSASSSTLSWKRAAKPYEVAALCAMMITKHDAATGSNARISLQVTFGSPKGGKPPGTMPMTAMPWLAK